MWCDRLAVEARTALVEKLRAVLPAPCRDPRSENVALLWEYDPADVAEALWHQRNLTWLDRPHALLFANPLVSLSVRDRHATVEGPHGTIQLEAGGFDLLDAALEAWGGPPDARLCGYLGYELGAELEDVRLPRRQTGDLPDLHLALYDWRLEHHAGQWRFCAIDAWRSVRPDGLEPLIRHFRHAAEGGWKPGTVSSTPDAEAFRAAVARAVERIRCGELFQVNLCRRLEAELEATQIWPLYSRLRAINPASQAALLRMASGTAVLSASPELFLSVEHGCVRSCPIKGTRARGATAKEDDERVRALQASEKDRAELAMIVDVTRNDLGRVCRPGTVAVVRHGGLMTLPTVHHTYSEVTGLLRHECGTVDLLRACFPPASITGAPKIRAMQVAAEEERYRRGPAMGAIGWIAMDGGLELSVAIRTAAASHGRVSYLAGCGITAESAPQEELEESEAKAAAFLRALGAPAAAR